jgi:hypothetical protein
MKLVSNSACALIFAALFAASVNQASAFPMRSLTVASQGRALPVNCKYGSGQCPDVKPVHQAPSTDKHGPQDPTVDPDCKAYGNCHDGPNGAPAAAAKTQTPTKPTAVVCGIKGESMDSRHPSTIDVQSRKTGASSLNSSAQNITVRKAGKGQQ